MQPPAELELRAQPLMLWRLPWPRCRRGQALAQMKTAPLRWPASLPPMMRTMLVSSMPMPLVVTAPLARPVRLLPAAQLVSMRPALVQRWLRTESLRPAPCRLPPSSACPWTERS
jgi:hypothetical protein